MTPALNVTQDDGPQPRSGAAPEHAHGLIGWVLYLWALVLLAMCLPPAVLTPGTAEFLLLIGAIGIWRYSLGATHFLRAMIFLHRVFPRHRAQAEQLGAAGVPSHAYFLVTSFRIDGHTTASVYRSVIAEAVRCGCPATVIASVVELGDERLIRTLWDRFAPPYLLLRIVRIAGTGKRDGLAGGFRAIARDLPDARAVVAVVDGDTLLQPGVMRKCAPYLALFPKVGALTTNEFCQVQGSYLMSEWHKLRFAQRHLNMCSMALSQRVLTLTGRMSLFRASVVIDPRFINDVENDALDHWRLGRFKFLTGDDKSSWYSLMRLGYDTYYVPDAAISTLEHPPSESFFDSSRELMFRWYGNSLRQNYRATRLGPGRLGWFTYYVLWDQRVAMWTGLLGLSLALAGSLEYGGTVLLAYALWIGISRLIITLSLVASGHRVGPMFPLVLYYNQIVGALIKVYVYFHLDRQSWTRQKTVLHRDLDGFRQWFNPWSSRAMLFSAASVYAAFVLSLV
jgi:glycosyltransferase Alg8